MRNVLIVSGHQDTTGAVALGNIESALTETLSHKVVEYLNLYNQNATEADFNLYDKMEENPKRLDMRVYDYILEIHFNITKGASGSEIFVHKSATDIATEKAIMKRLSKWFKLRDNDDVFDGVKVGDYLILNTLSDRKIALLEVAFMDNEQDMKIFFANQNEIAEGIALGILEGLGEPLPSQLEIEPPDVIAGDYYYFRIVAGSVKSRNEAYKKVMDLKKKGINAFVAYTHIPSIK